MRVTRASLTMNCCRRKNNTGNKPKSFRRYTAIDLLNDIVLPCQGIILPTDLFGKSWQRKATSEGVHDEEWEEEEEEYFRPKNAKLPEVRSGRESYSRRSMSTALMKKAMSMESLVENALRNEDDDEEEAPKVPHNAICSFQLTEVTMKGNPDAVYDFENGTTMTASLHGALLFPATLDIEEWRRTHEEQERKLIKSKATQDFMQKAAGPQTDLSMDGPTMLELKIIVECCFGTSGSVVGLEPLENDDPENNMAARQASLCAQCLSLAAKMDEADAVLSSWLPHGDILDGIGKELNRRLANSLKETSATGQI